MVNFHHLWPSCLQQPSPQFMLLLPLPTHSHLTLDSSSMVLVNFYVHWCFICMYVCEGGRSPELELQSFKLPFLCREFSSLEELLVILTAEPSLQPFNGAFKHKSNHILLPKALQSFLFLSKAWSTYYKIRCSTWKALGSIFDLISYDFPPISILDTLASMVFCKFAKQLSEDLCTAVVFPGWHSPICLHDSWLF